MTNTLRGLLGATVTGGKYEPFYYENRISGVEDNSMYYDYRFNPDDTPKSENVYWFEWTDSDYYS